MTVSADVGPERRGLIHVLVKASAVLDALEVHVEMTPTALADYIGEPRSSIYRMLDTLEELELISPGIRRGRVRLGMRLYRLGEKAVRGRDVREAAAAAMERLRSETGGTVFLAVRSGTQALCLARLDGLTVINNTLFPGTTGQLHIGGVGKALLAAESDDFVRDLASDGLVAFTEFSANTLSQLQSEIEAVRSGGVAVSDQDRLVGMAGLGAPVLDHRGQVCAAISFSATRPAVLGEQREENVEFVRRAAAAVSELLGAPAGAVPYQPRVP